MTITKTWGEWHCIDENGITVSPRFLTKQEACYWLVQFNKERKEKMSSYWGYHLMLDCSGCNDSISERDVIYTFIKDLVEQIDMVAHGEPIIEHLLQGDPKQGYSLMQLITTSNICAHFMDLDGTAYFDIFSCKEYDINLAQRIVQQYFEPKKMRVNFITRHAD